MLQKLQSEPVTPQLDTTVSPQALAVEQVLQSGTFSRAEQLRKFFRYICEAELAGKGSQISEYSIGVQALGRPPTFTPSEDGVVRNRAHVLRQKLLEYYTIENPRAPLRIELAKGSYVPRFVPADVPPHPEVGPALVPSLPVNPPAVRSRWRDLILGAAGGACLVAIVMTAMGRMSQPARVPAIIEQAWGRLAAADSSPIIVLGTPTQLVVRSYPLGATPKKTVDVALPKEAVDYFASKSSLPAGHELRLRLATAHRSGEVQGALAFTKIFDAIGVNYRVLPEIGTPAASLRARNAVMFGDPLMSPKVASYLDRGAFVFEFDSKLNDFVIRERSEDGATFHSTAEPTGLLEVPGLLSVGPSVDGPEGRYRSVTLACYDSAGCQSAAEYFCSPQSLRELEGRFRSAGLHYFPRAYQVIVMGKTDGNSVLSFRYTAHRVLDPSEP